MVFLFFLFCYTGEVNLTQTPSTPDQGIECECSGCEKSHCKAGFGCFSSVKPDKQNQGYVVKRGCIENQSHSMIICDQTNLPIVCCRENMCNRNVTPSVSPGWLGMFYICSSTLLYFNPLTPRSIICNFSLQYSYMIQQTGNENTQTFQAVVILI